MAKRPDQDKVARILKLVQSNDPAVFFLAAEVRWQADELLWQGEVLIMIVEQLKALGCCCDPEHEDATPPMCYDDWIRCVVRKRELEIKKLKDAIDAGGMHLTLCMSCGRAVIAIPDGMAMCEECAEEAAGATEDTDHE